MYRFAVPKFPCLGQRGIFKELLAQLMWIPSKFNQTRFQLLVRLNSLSCSKEREIKIEHSLLWDMVLYLDNLPACPLEKNVEFMLKQLWSTINTKMVKAFPTSKRTTAVIEFSAMSQSQSSAWKRDVLYRACVLSLKHLRQVLRTWYPESSLLFDKRAHKEYGLCGLWSHYSSDFAQNGRVHIYILWIVLVKPNNELDPWWNPHSHLSRHKS